MTRMRTVDAGIVLIVACYGDPVTIVNPSFFQLFHGAVTRGGGGGGFLHDTNRQADGCYQAHHFPAALSYAVDDKWLSGAFMLVGFIFSEIGQKLKQNHHTFYGALYAVGIA